MYYNDNKIEELLDFVYDCCTICPPPYDFNDKRFDGSDCPGSDSFTCQMCWKQYLSDDKEITPE